MPKSGQTLEEECEQEEPTASVESIKGAKLGELGFGQFNRRKFAGQFPVATSGQFSIFISDLPLDSPFALNLVIARSPASHSHVALLGTGSVGAESRPGRGFRAERAAQQMKPPQPMKKATGQFIGRSQSVSPRLRKTTPIIRGCAFRQQTALT
jgi:hypothetical protein